MPTPQPDWVEHATSIAIFVGFFIAGLFSLISWLMIRAIGKVDRNQTTLFKKYENHETRLSRIEGQHEARTGMKLSCAVEK